MREMSPRFFTAAPRRILAVALVATSICDTPMTRTSATLNSLLNDTLFPTHTYSLSTRSSDGDEAEASAARRSGSTLLMTAVASASRTLARVATVDVPLMMPQRYLAVRVTVASSSKTSAPALIRGRRLTCSTCFGTDFWDITSRRPSPPAGTWPSATARTTAQVCAGVASGTATLASRTTTPPGWRRTCTLTLESNRASRSFSLEVGRCGVTTFPRLPFLPPPRVLGTAAAATVAAASAAPNILLAGAPAAASAGGGTGDGEREVTSESLRFSPCTSTSASRSFQGSVPASSSARFLLRVCFLLRARQRSQAAAPTMYAPRGVDDDGSFVRARMAVRGTGARRSTPWGHRNETPSGCRTRDVLCRFYCRPKSSFSNLTSRNARGGSRGRWAGLPRRFCGTASPALGTRS